MRLVENPNDFFEPRPKLSIGVWTIRAAALFVATATCAGILLNQITSLRSRFQTAIQLDLITLFLVGALLQALVLVPCWRAWMLHRWGCIAVIFLCFSLPFGLAGVTVQSLAISVLCTGFLLAVIDVEKAKLKTGF